MNTIRFSVGVRGIVGNSVKNSVELRARVGVYFAVWGSNNIISGIVGSSVNNIVGLSVDLKDIV